MLESLLAAGLRDRRLRQKPELHEITLPYRRAFLELQAHRQMGFNGPQPLALTDIEAWLRLACIDDPADRQRFVDLIRIQDVEWRGLISKRAGSGGQQKIGEGKAPGE